MKVLISFTKLTKIILLNKHNYYRLLSVLFNNIYKCKHKLKRIQYSQIIILLIQIILLLTINNIVYKIRNSFKQTEEILWQ